MTGNDANTAVTFASTANVLVDTTPPTVVSIVRSGTSPTNASTVDFIVTFSEKVSGVAAAGFTVTAPSLTGTSVDSNLSSGGPNGPFTVTAHTGTGSGTLRLDYIGNFPDQAGNPSTATVIILDNETAATNSVLDRVFPTAPPPANALLRVTLDPANAFGQWRFVWEPFWRDSGVLA